MAPHLCLYDLEGKGSYDAALCQLHPHSTELQSAAAGRRPFATHFKIINIARKQDHGYVFKAAASERPPACCRRQPLLKLRVRERDCVVGCACAPLRWTPYTRGSSGPSRRASGPAFPPSIIRPSQSLHISLRSLLPPSSSLPLIERRVKNAKVKQQYVFLL